MLTLRRIALVLKFLALWAGIALGCGILGALWPIVTSPNPSRDMGLGIGIYIFGGLGLLIGTGVGAVIAFLRVERRALQAQQPQQLQQPQVVGPDQSAVAEVNR
jgi:hypothetical protein